MLSLHVKPSWPVVMAAVLSIHAGCTGDETSVVVEQTLSVQNGNLTGSAWQVEDIDEGGIIDRSMVTIEFVDEGRIAGSTGCNRYFGGVTYGEGKISLSDLGNTQRACLPAIMNQERRFLDALQSSARFEIRDGMWLLLFDAEDNPRIKAISSDSGTMLPPDDVPAVPADRAPDSTSGFSCADGPDFEVRFLGPETVRLSIAGSDHVLQRERTASGARYTGEGIVYWNKGDEAMLETPDGNYHCLRLEPEE